MGSPSQTGNRAGIVTGQGPRHSLGIARHQQRKLLRRASLKRKHPLQTQAQLPPYSQYEPRSDRRESYVPATVLPYSMRYTLGRIQGLRFGELQRLALLHP